MKKYLLHIGGQAAAPASGEWFESFNPYTGQPWALIPRGNAADVDRAVSAAWDQRPRLAGIGVE